MEWIGLVGRTESKRGVVSQSTCRGFLRERLVLRGDWVDKQHTGSDAGHELGRNGLDNSEQPQSRHVLVVSVRGFLRERTIVCCRRSIQLHWHRG